MKKFFTFISLCMIAFNAIHADVSWTLSNGTLTISGTDMPNYEYTYNNSINCPWYSQRVIIKKVVIEKGVTNIGNWAFYGCSRLTSVTIPESVTSIGGWAFYGCSALTSVTIPESVTSIGGYAFEGTKWYENQPDGLVYAGLVLYNYKGEMPTKTNILVKDGTKGIATNAFYECSSLTSVTIPNSVTSIGGSAFYNCSGLTSVTIGNAVTSIGGSAFYNCSGLTSITIPNSVTSIGSSAFYGCSSLKKIFNNSSLNMKKGWTANGYIARYADVIYDNVSIDGNFRICKDAKGNSYVCDYLGSDKSITLPKYIYGVAEFAFSGRSDITSVIIPESVTSIGKSTFSGCSGLSSIIIPENVTSIGSSAFDGCSGLSSIIIPENVTSIESSAFDGCSNLTSMVFYAKNCKSLFLPTTLRNLVIGNKVTSIVDLVFEKCNLQTLTIGTDVTSIGSNVMGANNSKPQKVIWLPNTPPSGYENVSGNINYVSNENYSNIQNTRVYKHLSSIFEVDGIKYVPVSPSERTCDAIDCNYERTIENVNISDVVSYKNIGMTVLNINPYACYGNEFIKNLNINNSGKIDERAFEGCKNITSVTFGNKVTSIGDYAFYGCTAIKDIKIPDCITSVGDYSFSGCSLLQKVVLGESPVSFGNYAFENCSSLAELNLGKKVKAIGNYTFANCSSLTKISIPQTTTSIGDYAFSGCKALADVTIEDRTKSISLGSNGSSPLFADCPISSVYLGGKLSYNTSSNSGYSPFYRNKSLQSVVIADTEEQIYDNEFYGCTNLKSVKIGDGVKSIGNWAFSGCANLESFSFGKSMQNIGNEAFSDCTKMTSITSFAATAPKCGSQALDDIDKWSCVLAVPYSSLASYQNADQWKEFFFIQETEPDNQTIANAVIAKITAIGKVEYTDACKGKIDEANKAYNALTADQKALVTNLDVLTKAQQTYETLKAAAEKLAADKAKADAVIAKITAIGKVEYTNACKGKIDDASKAYNALTDDQKALVTNLDVLTKAQQTYDNLKAAAEKHAEDKAKADAVIAKITAIGKVEYTDACKGKIDAANKAYNALTADQKALVTNLDILTMAQQTYETLKAAAEKLAADKAKADAVIAKITAIGKVEYTDACKDKINDANKAYNALSNDQKALVTNLEVLTNAQQTYETLKAAAEKLIADKAAFNKYKSEIIAIIEALVKDDDSDAVKEIIRKAISDIESLEYEEAISIDDNKAKVQSFVTSVNEAVENQRAEDQKTNGIEELEIAEKYNIYDLNGRKITNSMLKSGLYIRNGKKVVVK